MNEDGVQLNSYAETVINEVIIMVGWLEIGKLLLVLVGIFALIMVAPKWFFPKNGLHLG